MALNGPQSGVRKKGTYAVFVYSKQRYLRDKKEPTEIATWAYYSSAAKAAKEHGGNVITLGANYDEHSFNLSEDEEDDYEIL